MTPTLVGADALTDLAVLKLKATDHNFPYVTFDDASRRARRRLGGRGRQSVRPRRHGHGGHRVGDGPARRWARRSSYVDYIQIDAPINRGNSGGPTFDLAGNVIGVNSAIFSPTGGSVGIGFAIPSETARRGGRQC